jgi:hypothetical protein
MNDVSYTRRKFRVLMGIEAPLFGEEVATDDLDQPIPSGYVKFKAFRMNDVGFEPLPSATTSLRSKNKQDFFNLKLLATPEHLLEYDFADEPRSSGDEDSGSVPSLIAFHPNRPA